MTATEIVSVENAPFDYKPFKCVVCGLEGMAKPCNRPRKFCNRACANVGLAAVRREETAARKAERAASTQWICPCCSKSIPVALRPRDVHGKAIKHCGCRTRTRIMTKTEARERRRIAKEKIRRKNGAKPKHLHDSHVNTWMKIKHDAHVIEYKALCVKHDSHVRQWKANDAARAKWNYENIPEKNLYHKIKASMHKHLKSNLPSRKWSKHLGYSMSELKQHLERQFTKGMTWENKGKWHIDHITPASSFNFSSANDKEFHACFGLHNLRPMWGRENIQKGARLEFLL